MRDKKIILSVVLLLLLARASAPAETLLVPLEYATIEQAIGASEAGDEVVVLPGTYTGFGNCNIFLPPKGIIIRSISPQDPLIVAATVIDCNGTEAQHVRAFYMDYPDNDEAPDSVLDGLTMINGYAAHGGAIYCEHGSPIVKNCIIRGNIADYGGAVYCHYPDAAPTITDCTITGNTAQYGGAVYCDGKAKAAIADCRLSSNTAKYDGGAICCHAPAKIEIVGSTITENTAKNGGAVYLAQGKLNHCIISNNHATSIGGGVYCPYDLDSRSELTRCTITGNTAGYAGGGLFLCKRVNNCIITGNSADRGGGLCSCRCIAGCLIVGNTAYEDGAGILGRPTIITGCTVAGNSAPYGRGGGVFLSYGGPIWADSRQSCDECLMYDPLLTNSIFWANRDSFGTGQSAQIHTHDDYLCVSFSCIQDDDPNDLSIPWFSGRDHNNIDDNPMLVREPNDGGDGWGDDPCTPDVNEAANDDFGDLHLLARSPCIDAGDPCLFIGVDKGDIDAQPRIMGGRADIGADEFFLPWITVTKPAGGEVWVSGSMHEIRWESYGVDGKVDIAYSSNGGGKWKKVENKAPNTGTFSWRLPRKTDSNQCLVSVVPSTPDPNVILTESGLFTIHPDSPGPDVPARWRSLGGDFDRSGLSDTYGPELGCLKWQFETDGEVTGSVTVGKDDRVHIACGGGKLYTLDVNGVLLWSYDTNSPLLSSPTIGPDGTVYVGSEDGKLFAIDIDGNLRWTHTVDAFIYSSPAVSADGNSVFVGSGDGVLHALSRDGSELWSFETTGFGMSQSAIFASPAVGIHGTVYIGALYDPNLYALDPNDGSVKWVCRFESWPGFKLAYLAPELGWPFASPVVASDGTIYQRQLSEPNLYAIDPNTGGIIWSLDIPRPDCPYYMGDMACTEYEDVGDWAEPVLGPDGIIYAVFTGPCGPILDPYDWVPWRCLEAIDPNGTVKWSTALGVNGDYTLTVGTDDLVYAAGSDGYLLVIDANGRQLGRLANDRGLIFPVAASDGTVIVGDGNDNVLAIGSTGCDDKVFALHKIEDLDGSGVVSFGDFALLALDWLVCTNQNPAAWEPYCDYAGEEMHLAADVDRNLYVDWWDLRALGDRWLRTD